MVSFLPGTTGNLTWKFDDDVSTLRNRLWYFTPNGRSRSELLAAITKDDNPRIRRNLLSGVDVVKPATIILKNVSQSYNGKYEFILVGLGRRRLARPVGVRVFIASKYCNLWNFRSNVITIADHYRARALGES
jgi:hypothetical protein